METTIPSTINPRSNEPILTQALKMALDDEFHAYEAYISVIEKFGHKPLLPISLKQKGAIKKH